MAISLNWINDYVDISEVSPKDLALKVTKAGINVEKITTNHIDNLVFGEILECSPHPDSDHLNVCKVNVGDEVLQIVCGASNVRSGLRVIVALPGAILPGDFEIKKSTIRGIESNGMICALFELGLEEKTDENYNKGIYEADNNVPIGENPLKYLELDDTLFELDLNPNRTDCNNHIPFAYEVAAVLKKEVKEPETDYKETNEKIEDLVSLEVPTENVSMYNLIMAKDVKIKESPTFIKNRLESAGIRSINNVVDISNYVMLEYGNPLHFFDKDKVGNKIVVRMAKDNEVITTLDNEERVLTNEDIVISNGDTPLCIAGVMGGLNSGITNDTKDILIESAIFNPLNVRKTSIRLGLRSEASLRLEKPLSYEYSIKAIKRACHLLECYADAKIVSGINTYDKTNKDSKIIEVALDEINSILGMNLNNHDVMSSLRSLGFSYDTLYELNPKTVQNIEPEEEKQKVIDIMMTKIGDTLDRLDKGENKEENADIISIDNTGIDVENTNMNLKYIITIPNRRQDIYPQKEDIIEEVGRIYGYDNIVPTLPIVTSKKGEYRDFTKFRKIVSKRMRSLGFNEIRTYTLISEEDKGKYNYNFGEIIKLNRPMNKEKSFVRQSLLSELVNTTKYNLSKKNNNIMLYEIANVYSNDEEYSENTKLAFILHGNYIMNNWQKNCFHMDYYFIKGVLENLLNYLGLDGRYSLNLSSDLPKEIHPKINSEITVQGVKIGYIGKLHPNVSKEDIFVGEISLTELFKFKSSDVKYKELNKYPKIEKDLAFIVDKNINSEDIQNEIKKIGGKLLTNVNIFDIYTGDKIDSNKKSLAYNLTFEDFTRTLTEDEVMDIFNKIIKCIESKFNAILRDK